MSLSDDVVTWVRGWSAARAGEVWPAGDGVVEVVIDSPHRNRELVLVDPTAGELTGALGEASRSTWVTVVGEVPEGVRRPSGVRVRSAEESLMAADPLPEAPLPPPEWETRLDDDGVRLRAEVWVEGRLAAHGAVAVTGPSAVFDQILTEPDFRRRGLGSVVMGLLTAAGRERGAVRGLLVASVDGQRLYEHLGWEHRSPVTIFHRPKPGRGGPA